MIAKQIGSKVLITFLSLALLCFTNYLGKYFDLWLLYGCKMLLYFLAGLILSKYFPAKFNLLAFAIIPILIVIVPFLFEFSLYLIAFNSSLLLLTEASLLTGYLFFRMRLTHQLLFPALLMLGYYGSIRLILVPTYLSMSTNEELIGKSINQLMIANGLTNAENKEIPADFFENKVTLIEVYFSRCGPCIVKDKTLKEVERKYEGQTGFQVLYIDSGDNDTFEEFIKAKKEGNVFYDHEDQWIKKLGIQGFPHELIVDKKGVIRRTHKGFGPELVNAYLDLAQSKIDTLLKETE